MPALKSHPISNTTPVAILLQGPQLPQAQGADGRQITSQATHASEAWLRDRQHGLVVVIQRLVSLLDFTEPEDKPSEFALTVAANLLIEANPLMRSNFPSGSVGTDGASGIRLQWNRSGREIRLVIPAHSDGRMYIYYQSGKTYGIVENVSGRGLAYWLDWLIA